MAYVFFYHNPLDDTNLGSSHMMCEASCEGRRTGPRSAILTINIKFLAIRESLPQTFTYGYNITSNGNANASREISIAFTDGEEFNYTENVEVTVTPTDTTIPFYFQAYRKMSSSTKSGYDINFSTYIPAYITAPVISVPTITELRPNQVSFYWAVTNNGGEDPVLCTEFYNYPGREGQWTELEDVNYGNVAIGTVLNLQRYTSYSIRAHATNSAGSSRSEEVVIRTLPERPVLTPLIVSNVTMESFSYSFSVADNGGKAITEYGLYIIGGQYSVWTKISNSNSGTITGLQHNTNYELRGYATNANSIDFNDSQFTNYSENKLTTLGNNPVINEFRVDRFTNDAIILIHEETFDNNAVLGSYLIQYKKVGASQWISLPTNTRLINGLDAGQAYDIKLIVTDNFGRSSSKQIVARTSAVGAIIVNKPIVTVSGNNITVTEDYRITSPAITIYKHIIAISIDRNLNNAIVLSEEESRNPVTKTFNINQSSDTFLHPYKNYSIFYIIVDNFGNTYSSDSEMLRLNQETGGLKLIKSNGNVVIPNKTVAIDQQGNLMNLNYKNFIRLSKSMRYILIGSSGLIAHTYGESYSITKDIWNFRITIEFSLRTSMKNHVLVTIDSVKIRSKTSDSYVLNNNDLEIKIASIDSNSNIVSKFTPILNVYNVTPGDQECVLNTIYSYLLAEDRRNFLVEISIGDNYYFNRITVSETVTISDQDFINSISSNWSCNSLVEIDVYDESNNNIALGKTLKCKQLNSAVRSISGGNATDGNHSDPSKYVEAYGCDTIILDLGQEYKISKLDIWRRWDSNSDYTYGNNFVYGLNKDKEICYKFIDLIDDNSYGFVETSSGRSINVT